MQDFYVYILANWTNEVLYIGMTSNLERRMAEHKSKQVPGFSNKYYLNKLVYVEAAPDAMAAIAREKQLKKWRREKKDNLIEKLNPNWKDLADNWR